MGAECEVEERVEGAGGDGYFAGPTTTMPAVRDRSKDNGDGTVTVGFVVSAGDVPKDLTSSPLHSVWSLFVDSGRRQHRLTGAREAMLDKDDGRVAVRFAVFASSNQPESVYGNKGDAVMLTVNLVARENNHPFMSTPASRHSVMQRCVMMCDDPNFPPWIADQCRKDGYPVVEAPAGGAEDGPGSTAAQRAVEHLYRVARVHSRADVMDSNAAAGRVEDVMRRYRAHLWDTRDRARRAGRVG